MNKPRRVTLRLFTIMAILTFLAGAFAPTGFAEAQGESPSIALAVPAPLSPASVITDTTPTFKWTQVTGATSYNFQVLKEYSSTVVYSYTVQASGSCYSHVCSYTPSPKLGYFGYRWRVRVSGSPITWSPLTTFYIRGKSFSNHFTYGLMYWWNKKSGGDWYAQYNGGVSGFLVSAGLPDKCSAVVHYTSSTYDNFVAEAKMKITGTPSGGKYPEAYLALRMQNSVDSASQCWYGGYLFGYSRDGYYSFWKMKTDGTWYALIPPTYDSIINKNDWNNFYVNANGNRFYLYINKKYIGTVLDNSYKLGYIGFEMRNHGSAATKFWADWITVDTLP